MNERIKGHMLACMTILIWGTTFISTKVLLRDFTPLQILFSVYDRLSGFMGCRSKADQS